jgi:hypothetical protein
MFISVKDHCEIFPFPGQGKSMCHPLKPTDTSQSSFDRWISDAKTPGPNVDEDFESQTTCGFKDLQHRREVKIVSMTISGTYGKLEVM